jgi:iron(II)-dependent oxidoreductase
MTSPRLLGALDNLHRMMADLVQALPDADVRRQFHPALHPPGWYLGRAVYLETYWLRERLLADADLSGRVRHIFAPGSATPAQTSALLPPRDHLLNWALEIQDEHLTRLANPGLLPPHPLLAEDWLPSHLWQVQSLLYEQLLLVLIARQIARSSDGDYQPAQPLVPQLPTASAASVSQGHYRIGAREGVAFDNELPVQAVELHSYRIGRQPVSNAEYLAFMDDGGYGREGLWSEDGRAWLAASGCTHPYGWRRSAAGNWHGIGLNGPYGLVADDPVTGLSLHEAQAFATWTSGLGGELAGAVLPHEYQWETAVRTQAITEHGRALEWCSNTFEPYDAYAAPADPELATAELDGRHQSVRGASVHTQPCLRRASLRRAALPDDRHLLAGCRLVLPPAPS